jgi:hypothetical protein
MYPGLAASAKFSRPRSTSSGQALRDLFGKGAGHTPYQALMIGVKLVDPLLKNASPLLQPIHQVYLRQQPGIPVHVRFTVRAKENTRHVAKPSLIRGVNLLKQLPLSILDIQPINLYRRYFS